MSAPVIAFDLDGTLVDTAPDLIGTLNVILAREGLRPVSYETARTMIGAGVRALLERGLLAEGLIAAPAELERLFTAFIDHYESHIADLSRPFEGVETALDELARHGFRLAICTNKLEGLSVKLLDALGLSGRFAAICGQDTFGIHKPNPDMLRMTIARAGGAPAQAIMVGDSATDISTAKAAGIPVVAVDFGYTETPITELAPDRVIRHYDELVGAIGDLLRQPLRATGAR